MTYASAEASLLTRIQACTGFSSTNTARGSLALLNSGASDHYAILRRGPSEIEWITLKAYTGHYTCMVQIWQRYTDDGTTYTNLLAYIDNILAILTYPHLAGGLEDSSIGAIGEVEEMWGNAGDGPFWLRCQIEVRFDDTTIVTFAE